MHRPVGGDLAGPMRWAPVALALVLTILLLGPALLPGFVLSYDMVWVPDLALGQDALGLTSALPRAVPSDAFVAVADELIPGMVLQKLMLVGTVTAAAVGSARLAREVSPSLSTGAPWPWFPGLVAATVAVWNPLTAERWWLGHWPILVGVAVLPWLAVSTDRWRRGDAGIGPVLGLCLIGSLSANAGLATAVLLVICAARGSRRGRVRRVVSLSIVVLVANGPWLFAGLAHLGSATSARASVFAPAGEGLLPLFPTLLSLGGIWNTEVVPPSRMGPAALVWLGFLVLTVGVGLWVAARRAPRATGADPDGDRARSLIRRLALAATLGLLFAVAPALTPGTMDAVASTVPGGGLLRDSARFLVLCLPAWSTLAGLGAWWLVSRVPATSVRMALAAGAVLLPIAVLPDAAWGIGGALRPADYPADYAAARTVLSRSDQEGAVLVLPLTSYRTPAWNGGRKVFAPTGRAVAGETLVSDDLVVDGRSLGGEDPRVAAAAAALTDDDPDQQAARLADVGVGWVLVESGAEYSGAGTRVLRGSELSLFELPGSPASATLGATRWMVVAGWVLWGVGWLSAAALLVSHLVSRFRRSR